MSDQTYLNKTKQKQLRPLVPSGLGALVALGGPRGSQRPLVLSQRKLEFSRQLWRKIVWKMRRDMKNVTVNDIVNEVMSDIDKKPVKRPHDLQSYDRTSYPDEVLERYEAQEDAWILYRENVLCDLGEIIDIHLENYSEMELQTILHQDGYNIINLLSLIEESGDICYSELMQYLITDLITKRIDEY